MSRVAVTCFAYILALGFAFDPARASDSLVVREARSYGRLTIFPISSDNEITRTYLTLEEALRTGRAVIHENNSQTLWIENLSDTDLFIQSSEILKGGQQDRMIAHDMVLAAHDTSYALTVYCVEHGRSFKRGAEPIETFSGSSEMAPSHHMQLVARHEMTGMLRSPHLAGLTAPNPDELQLLESLSGLPQFSVVDDAAQESIWHDIEQTQSSLTRTLRDSVTRTVSPSSLQLTLENSSLEEKRRAFVKRLGDVPFDDTHTVGIVYAIDGKIVGCELYGSHALFSSMWPKLLRSLATEVIAMPDAVNPATADLTPESVAAYINAPAPGKRVTKEINTRTLSEAGESQFAFIFDTRDTKYPTVRLHRLYTGK